VIVPTYRDLDESLRELSLRLDALGPSSTPDDLAALRESYRAARAPLEAADAFAFGPAVDLGSSTELDSFPIDAAQLDNALAGAAELTPQSIGKLRPNTRGLHAIEYLLFPEDDVAWELALLDDSADGARRRLYIKVAGSLAARAGEALYRAWADEPGGYGRRFAEPGKPDSVLASAQPGIDMLLMEAVFLSEHVADLELGRPRRRLGAAEPVELAPRESERAGMALADVHANVRGMWQVYCAGRGSGDVASISRLVRAKRPDTDARVLAAFDEVELAVGELPEVPSESAVDAQTVERAFAGLKNLRHLLATEVLGALGSSLALDLRDGD
jgi:predicted lipoprotein